MEGTCLHDYHKGEPAHTSIDGVSFQTTLGRISSMETKVTNLMVNTIAITYNPMTFLTTFSGDVTFIGKLNGNKIGTPTTYKYNDEAPFIPVVGSDCVIEIGLVLMQKGLATQLMLHIFLCVRLMGSLKWDTE